MSEARLPPPEYSSAEIADRVVCTLLNNIEDRSREMSGTRERVSGSPAVVANIFPVRVQSPAINPDDPFGGDEARPSFHDVRTALLKAMRESGLHVDSFASTSAVDFSEEFIISALRGRNLLSIYPGVEFRLVEFANAYFLVLDHTVEVRNRADAARVRRAIPWIDFGNRRRCFVRVERKWAPGFIVDDGESFVDVELKDDVDQEAQPAAELVKVPLDAVVPFLNTTVELPALVAAEGVRINLSQEIRRASLVGVPDPSRRRWERVEELALMLAQRVFPVVIGPHEIRLTTAPVEITGRPFRFGRRLSDPKAVFDKQGRRQEDDIRRGLTTFGSLDKPQTELPLVLLGPARWIGEMQNFVDRLRLGERPYRGMDVTFGVKLGLATTVVSEPDDYERKARETIAQLPEGSRPVFIVLSPLDRAGQTTYESPYYRTKRLLLEYGYPSQMVNEDTIQNPEWKDLTFALDIFAKAGYVPWVLGEGLPQADLFIGLSSSLITHAGTRSRVIGYANVFDEYGRWLYYQGSVASVPFDQRNQMFAGILAEITRDYQARRRKPQWVHVHHSAKLRRVDRDEIARGIHSEVPDAEISFVHVNEHAAYRLFDRSARGDGAAARGTWLSLTPNRFLLATTGPNPSGQRYLGTPRPVEVSVNRISGQGRLDISLHAQHMLSLTRLNWASTRSFCHTPITIKFANDIAHLMNVFHSTGEDFRLHPRLRDTPWFL